jgi:hypothetical protein
VSPEERYTKKRRMSSMLDDYMTMRTLPAMLSVAFPK